MTHGCVWALLCLFLVSCSGSLQQKAATPYEEDIALLKTRLKADPSDLKTVQQLGILFYRAGQYKNAITTLGKAHDRDPQDPLSLAYLGLSLEENGSIADAIGMYGRFQDLSEAGEYYYWLKGRQLLAQKRLDHLQLARDLLAFDGLATPVWQEGRVAIAALTYYGEDSRYAGLGLVLAEMLTRRMGEVGIPNLIPVEKISLYNSLAELPPFSENLDPSAKTLGQFFAAPIVLTGGYNIIDGNVVADFTVWDVRSSEEPRRVTRLGSLTELEKILRRMGGALVEKIPEAGKIRNGEWTDFQPLNWSQIADYSRGVYHQNRGEYLAAVEAFRAAVKAGEGGLPSKERLERARLLAISVQDPIKLYALPNLAKQATR